MSSVVIADPAPLGLAGFGITTLMLSSINSGWIGGAAAPLAVLSLAIPFGGAAQALAGMWAFRRGNTFAATAFTSFGAFWISYYLLVNFFAGGVAAADGVGSVRALIGLYLFCWGLFTTYMFVASLGSARAVQVVFLLLFITFYALAIGAWTDPATVGLNTWTHIGGYLGVATAVAALYTSFADVANANLKRTVFPT
jgi:succinate-acetate transporter protein